MIIGVVKETKEYENRVALSPEVVKLVRKKGFEVVVESGAGEKSFFSKLFKNFLNLFYML